MRCWNCLRALEPREHACPVCAQPREPNPAQSGAARARLQYLLRETEDWAFLPSQVREQLASVYQNRLHRLDSLENRNAEASWPGSDWTSPLLQAPWLDPTLVAEPLRSEEEPPPLPSVLAPLRGANSAAVTESLETSSIADPLPPSSSEDAPAPPQLPPFPSHPGEDGLAARMLAEADIRWFHSLGALLVVAAVVGWLRATWDGYGRNLAGVLILLSPAALHVIAHSLRRSVPLSARLLSILAGLLTVPALLAVEVFDFLPPAVAGRDYWTLAFLVSGCLLAGQAQAMREKVPLFAGVLCLVMAGVSQGALLTSALCLMVGFLLGPVKADPQDGVEAREWKEQLQRAGLAAGLFGCFATLFMFEPQEGSLKPLLAFTGGLFYLHLPSLTRQGQSGGSGRVALQACVTVIGLILMRVVLDLPPSGVGLYTLLAAGLFLSARPDHPGGLLALRIGAALGLVGLAVGFFASVPIPLDQPGADPVETAMRFALALCGAGLFGYLSRQPHLRSQAALLGLGAMLATLGGWTHLFLLICPSVQGSYFAENGQLAPLLASYGLWVALWVIGSRWLRHSERALVLSVALPVLLSSMLACLASALALHPRAAVWSPPLAWLGLVALAWKHGVSTSPDTGDAGLAQAQEQALPRMALWSLVASAMLSQAFPPSSGLLPLMILGLLLELGPLACYRLPGLELAWLCAPFALSHYWNSQPFPPQVGIAVGLFLVGWAAPGPRSREVSLTFSALLAFGVVLGSRQGSHLALLGLPLAYGVSLALPAPRQGWSKPGQASHGLDLLLGGALFLPLQLSSSSPASLLVAAATLALVLALGEASRREPTRRAVNEHSPHALLLWAFVWTLGQGSRESGLLVLLASFWAYRLPNRRGAVRSDDLANGLALLGVGWLAGEGHAHPSLSALGLALLASECLALVRPGWRPDWSNALFALVAAGLAADPAQSPTALGLAGLAGAMVGVRGLIGRSYPLMVCGYLLFLEIADQQLALTDASFKLRLLPTAGVLIGSGLWLLTRPTHDGTPRSGPLAGLRLGIALLSLPPLLALAVLPSFSDFLWVLTVGGSCLLAAPLLAAHPEASGQLRQAGGYVLAGWAAVSLGRAVMILPWQLATMVVGLILVGVGVGAEKRRKRAASAHEGE